MSQYSYSYYGPMEDGLEEMFGSVFSGFGLAAAGIGLVLTVAVFVMRALALYRIAQRRGLSNAWLAWVPVANAWLLGSISDQYRYLVRGENTYRRRTLLWLNVANSAGVAVMVSALLIALGKAIASGAGGNQSQIMAAILGPVMTMLGVAILLMIVSIIYTVFYFIALSDVFRSCDPANATVFLVLSILGSLASGFISYTALLEPIFLLVTHSRDLGMPPRKPDPQSTYTEPTFAQPEEPWVQE